MQYLERLGKFGNLFARKCTSMTYRGNYGYLRLELSLYRIRTHRHSFISHWLHTYIFHLLGGENPFFDNGIRQFRNESTVMSIIQVWFEK